MRKTMLAMAAAVAILVPAAGAIAQSGQGGYLGLNPGRDQAASAAAPTHPGSGQGGYLGLNNGANLLPPRSADASTAPSPTGWCSNSIVPGRCARMSQGDHDWCQEHDADHYERCRRVLDLTAQMGK